jgi:hypothetical protein
MKQWDVDYDGFGVGLGQRQVDPGADRSHADSWDSLG